MSGLDLIVEVGAEEIPAGYMAPALAALKERLGAKLEETNLDFEKLDAWATPRRLAFAVYGLADGQPDVVKEVTGPPAKAAFDADGNPTKAAIGFAKGQGADVSDLMTVETAKGPYVAVKLDIKGRPAAEVLSEILPPLILGLPFPKSMRWGKGGVVFVRPIHWLLAVLDGKVLPMSLGEIRSGNQSYGHRFMHPEAITVNSPREYEERLAEGLVIVNHDRREEMVREEIDRVIRENGGDIQLLPDDELVEEVADLAETPAACLGKFDDIFLELPQDIPTTAMREHQRYFALTDKDGKLAPYFIAINNTRARDMNVVRNGHERVLRARLDDARFYFKEDRKHSLEFFQEELKRVVFHQRLGTSWQKVERFSKLAEYLADSLAPSAKNDVLRAASLCKCDLVSGVVGEFPSLQGIIGCHYALADGEPEAVAKAIFEHYMPVRAGGDLPGTTSGALLSLADKMDTIASCFGVGLTPTGAADPFALRRQALGVINIILDRAWRIDLDEFVGKAVEGASEWLKKPAEEVKAEVLEFIRLRLKNQLVAGGASADGAEAVLALHFRDMVPAVTRLNALEKIKAQPDFEDLAAAFKRVVNIIKKFGARDDFKSELLKEDQEKELSAAAEKVEAQVEGFLGGDDFSGLLTDIVGLKPAVDSFFDGVLVDDPDPTVKANRLALLTRVSKLFDNVADFSKIST